jgi:hypothetical protein
MMVIRFYVPIQFYGEIFIHDMKFSKETIMVIGFLFLYNYLGVVLSMTLFCGWLISNGRLLKHEFGAVTPIGILL